MSRHLTDPGKVARIVRWFDALNVVQPNTLPAGCALILSVPVRFVFRSASGANLASAIVPSAPAPASSCNQIQFTIHGQRQTPLIDNTPEQGRTFIDRVQRLLGVRFGPHHRPGQPWAPTGQPHVQLLYFYYCLLSTRSERRLSGQSSRRTSST